MNTKMSEPKFTPKPWEVKFSMCEDMTFASIEKENHKTIAEVFMNDNEDEQEANAYLIKAAPDMYEALELVCEDCREGGVRNCVACVVGKAKRKARGESEVIQ